MGGSLAVTIRTPDGKWHKMDRWTNSSFWTLGNPKFLEGDATVIKDYLDVWYDMCAKYDNGTYKTDAPMASAYCNWDYSSRDKIMPSEYGIAFVDFENKLFINMNGYTHYNGMGTYKVARLINEMQWDEDAKKELDVFAPGITKLRTLNRKASTGPDNIVWDEIELDFATGDDLIAYNNTLDLDSFSEYMMDMGDWEYIELQDDNKSSLKFLQILQERGYELTAEEEDGFKQFRNYDSEME